MSEISSAFVWTRSETIALAQQSCTYCLGLGLKPGREGKEVVCGCVLRAIFRACYGEFRIRQSREGYLTRTHAYDGFFNSRRQKSVSVSAACGGNKRHNYSNRTAEYIADFCRVAERTLDERLHRIFRYHFLLGADWKLCCRKLGTDRGNFFHDVYRIQERLGRAFRETRPYGLFPVGEYFAEIVRGPKREPIDEVFPVVEEGKESGGRAHLRFPLKRPA